jgi:hypothetical protein
MVSAMIPRGNVFHSQRALASIRRVRAVASGLVHTAYATQTLFFDSRLTRARSLGNQLLLASSAASPRSSTTTLVGPPDSTLESERKESKQNLRPSRFSKPSGTGLPSLGFTGLLGVFSRVFHSLAAPRGDRRETHHHKSNRNDKTKPTPLADFKQNGGRFLEQLATPFASILNRTSVRASWITDDITKFLKAKSVLSQLAKWGLDVVAAIFLLGAVSKILKSDLFEPFMEGLRLVGASILALRWLPAKSVPAIISGLSGLDSSVAAFTDMFAKFVVMFAAIEFGSILLVGGINAATIALAIAGYELYRHWDAAKRLLSQSVDSVHKAAARLLKWLDKSVGSAIPFASGALVADRPANRNVLRFSAARAATARGMNRARAVENAPTVVVPAPTLRAVRRAAAAAAFATPLMLTAGSVSTFATPFISTNDTTRIAAPLSAVGMTQGPIVINYTPNVVIHSEHAADIATLKRRVMEILERHGRELHQVLAREIVRQQRTEFNSLLSNH